jgi:hypothetical protein
VIEPSDEEEDEEGYEDEDAPRPEPLGKGEKNSHLTVGYKGDAFVVRGSKIGVFRQRSDGEVQYQASIGNVATPKGKSFKPSKVSACLGSHTRVLLTVESAPR